MLWTSGQLPVSLIARIIAMRPMPMMPWWLIYESTVLYSVNTFRSLFPRIVLQKSHQCSLHETFYSRSVTAYPGKPWPVSSYTAGACAPFPGLEAPPELKNTALATKLPIRIISRFTLSALLWRESRLWRPCLPASWCSSTSREDRGSWTAQTQSQQCKDERKIQDKCMFRVRISHHKRLLRRQGLVVGLENEFTPACNLPGRSGGDVLSVPLWAVKLTRRLSVLPVYHDVSQSPRDLADEGIRHALGLPQGLHQCAHVFSSNDKFVLWFHQILGVTVLPDDEKYRRAWEGKGTMHTWNTANEDVPLISLSSQSEYPSQETLRTPG